MKTTFIKRISAVWIAFVLLFSLTVPVLANGNGGAASDKEGYEMVKIEAGSLKDGQETQGFLTVTVTETEENEVKSISWTSETPVYFVYVKGGPSGIEKEYGNGATKGSDLTAPDNKGISHVAFYYKQETEEQQNDESEEENGETEDKNSESEEVNGESEDKNSESEKENGKSVEENNESEEENGESVEENNESEEENGETEENSESEEENDESTKEDKESDEDTKENANKSTEIHLHLKNCTAPVEKVEVQLKGNWEEMSNPGNSPLYKLKDGGEYVKDEITAFRLSFESGEKQTYDMDDVRAGNEAEGSINYWLEGCSIEEDENAEEPGDGSEEPGDGSEEPGDGTEEPGDGNGDDNGEENGERSTEIHLHLKNCLAPVESVYVELNGEWVEMSNPGNSPLYKLKDDGEYVKDDITAFKLVFKSGAERFYNLEDIRVGVEAEGSINYWIEDCVVPEDENTEEPGDGTEEPGDNDEEPKEDGESPDVTEIVKELYIIINKNIESVIKLTLLIDGGENIEFIKMNNLWKLIIANGLDVSDIKGIELEFEDGTTKVLLISKLSFELNDQVIHLEIDEAVLGIDREEESDEDEGTGKSDNNSENGGDGKQNWYGNVLPKTGESSKMMFYIAGFLLMAAGTGLRMRKPIKH